MLETVVRAESSRFPGTDASHVQDSSRTAGIYQEREKRSRYADEDFLRRTLTTLGDAKVSIYLFIVKHINWKCIFVFYFFLSCFIFYFYFFERPRDISIPDVAPTIELPWIIYRRKIELQAHDIAPGELSLARSPPRLSFSGPPALSAFLLHAARARADRTRDSPVTGSPVRRTHGWPTGHLSQSVTSRRGEQSRISALSLLAPTRDSIIYTQFFVNKKKFKKINKSNSY